MNAYLPPELVQMVNLQPCSNTEHSIAKITGAHIQAFEVIAVEAGGYTYI
ncbi:hypothetical protein [Limnohabitans sp. T6-5]|nr:hypothetical protein [Limnohabitans sp. T6-5]